jgi:16S rRNA G966 N2-methylase RsmD
MGAATHFHGELINDFNEFFAPVSTDLISTLVARYDAKKAKIEEFAALHQSADLGGVIDYFCRRREDKAPTIVLENAICALNADFWAEALSLTDVYDAMPQKRRDQWNEQMRAWQDPRYKKGENPAVDLPDFEEKTVRSTLTALLTNRSQFFAERVDGIFRALSKAHVTNTPQGFGKRMILSGVLSYGSPDWQVCGHINDLRCVIAKFMGRDDPHHRSSDPVVRAAQRVAGEWISVDGGALRIRVYNGVGTAHLEVHPEMAWRLNAILASIYPAAIPESLRRKPVKIKKIKDFELFDRPLPFVVLSAISAMEEARIFIENAGWNQNKTKPIRNSRELRSSSAYDKTTIAEIDKVMAAIGATKLNKEKVGSYYQFDYEPTLVIDQVVCSGCIPDHKSHQFYPTPERVAQAAIELADISETDICLEPSAGIGGLADFMPKDRTTCVEFSALHCEILKEKGFHAVNNDFLAWTESRKAEGKRFDKIAMNPPYSEGRWKAHTEAAAQLVNKTGTLVAVLPSSAKNSFDLGDGWNIEWSRTYDNEFSGTSISVVIMAATRK